MCTTVLLIKACLQFGVACGFENPNNSRMWRVPALAKLCHQPGAVGHVCDFCQYGSPFRKRTRVVLWGTGECSSIKLTCAGSHGCCSASGRPHQIIKGFAADGRTLLSQVAEPYPVAIVSKLDAYLENYLKFATPRCL
jgi:hypothetical protein